LQFVEAVLVIKASDQVLVFCRLCDSRHFFSLFCSSCFLMGMQSF
jgi:hypothetical protein